MLRLPGHSLLMRGRPCSCARPSSPALIGRGKASAKRRASTGAEGSGSPGGGGGGGDADTAATAAAAPPSSPYVFKLGDGDVIFVRPPRQDVGPSYDLTWEQAVDVQLAALRQNDRVPSTGARHPDHGVEVLYRFADFSPFERARYFGRSLDLGQFERFRRVMHSPHYKPLLNHARATTLSTLRLGERCWRARVMIEASDGGSSSGLVRPEERVYELTMVQRLGGVHDGYWFTSSLVAEGNLWTDVLAM